MMHTNMNNRDSHYDNFVRTMRKDGIPAKTYQEVNWKQWIQDQWDIVVSGLRKL